MNVDLYLIAPVLEGQSLVEVHERWSLDDLADWHEATEIKGEAKEFYHKRAMENARR